MKLCEGYKSGLVNGTLFQFSIGALTRTRSTSEMFFSAGMTAPSNKGIVSPFSISLIGNDNLENFRG